MPHIWMSKLFSKLSGLLLFSFYFYSIGEGTSNKIRILDDDLLVIPPSESLLDIHTSPNPSLIVPQSSSVISPSIIPQFSLPIPTEPPSIYAGVSKNSVSSVLKQSRTEQTFSKLTGRNLSAELLQNTIQSQSDGYWRCCALRMQDRWISTMSEKDWIRVSERYNDQKTFIDPNFYRVRFPTDPVHRDPNSLKRFCIEFEETCRKWKVQRDDNKKGLFYSINLPILAFSSFTEISSWKEMHLTLPLPERPTTISKYNRITRVKICNRCCKSKDGMGLGKGHQRDCCDDGFPIWKNVPYPLPTHMASLQNGRSVISIDVCITRFRELAKAFTEVDGNILMLSLHMQNVYTFETLARLPTVAKSLHEAVTIGASAYNFQREYIERRRIQ